MIDSLTTAIAIYAGFVTVVALGCFAVVKGRPFFLDSMVFILEAALLIRAMVGVAAMATGRHDVPGATHIAYLISSVAILPVMFTSLIDDRSRWSAAVIAAACLAILVIAIRLEITWSGGV